MMRERRCPVKTMRLTLYPGERIVPTVTPVANYSSMRVFNLVFEAEAFLYKLIRRITGTLMHLAKGQMTREDVLNRFACPPDYYSSSFPTTLKPHGLFLYEVKYNEEDFLNPPVLTMDPSRNNEDLDDEGTFENEDEDDDEEENLVMNGQIKLS